MQEDLKKAFIRGVSQLNLEAINILSVNKPEQEMVHPPTEIPQQVLPNNLPQQPAESQISQYDRSQVTFYSTNNVIKSLEC